MIPFKVLSVQDGCLLIPNIGLVSFIAISVHSTQAQTNACLAFIISTLDDLFTFVLGLHMQIVIILHFSGY